MRYENRKLDTMGSTERLWYNRYRMAMVQWIPLILYLYVENEIFVAYR